MKYNFWPQTFFLWWCIKSCF